MSVPIQRAPRRSPRRLALWTIATLFVIAAVVLLAACGSSNSSSGSSSSPSASATPTTAATWTPADLAAVPTDSSLKAMLPSGVVSANVIKVGSDIPYPPWESYNPPTSKNPAGFDFDLSQALGKTIGIPVSFFDVPFDSIPLALKAGKIDGAMSDMYDNVQREKSGISFVDYAADGTSILVKKGNPNGITTLQSLAGKTVACESGTTQQALLQTLNTQFKGAGKSAMTILALPNQPAALLAVTSGRAVGDLTDHSTAVNIAETTNNGSTYEVVADPAAPKGYVPQLVGIAIAANNTQLVTTMQKALQKLIDEGIYQKIVNSYGLFSVPSAQVNQGPAFAAAQAASMSASPSATP